MHFYFDVQNQLMLKEKAVDCSTCSIDFKCCTYRPFFSNFLVGYADSLHLLKENWFEQWDLFIVGAAPNARYRKKFMSKGGWGFGSDANLLCTFFNTNHRGCEIWPARPSVCRSFFCKSTYAQSGLDYWKKFEDYIWHLEWSLIEDFLFTRGYTIDEVQMIKHYLDHSSDARVKISQLEDFRFKSWDEAQSFYRSAWEHVKSVGEAEANEIVGEFGRNLYHELKRYQVPFAEATCKKST